jgi:hypothetical protein
MRERSKRRRTLAPTRPGIAWRRFSEPSQEGPGGGTQALHEVHYRSVMDVTGESLAIRNILIASMAVLSIACGHEKPTAPTSTTPPASPITPPVRLAANYEVVFVADAACTGLPPVARTRTYTGVYDGAFVHLSGSDFTIPAPIGYFAWDVILLGVSGHSATAYFSDPPIWEHPTPDTDLMIEGNATGGTVSSDGQISFSFRGSFLFCRGECAGPPIACSAQNHRLTLTPK